MHVKGYAAPETKAAAERARLLIEQAEALGEPPEDPLAVVLGPLRLLGREQCSRSTATSCASLRRSSWRSLRSKERQLPLMIGHRLMGGSLVLTGEIAEQPTRISIRRSRFTILPRHRSLAHVWPRHRQCAILSIGRGSVAAWLSRGRARGRGRRAQIDARDDIGHRWLTRCGLFAKLSYAQ